MLAPSPHGEVKYDFMYYLKGAAAGGICCSITHGALTPVDVDKTRVQLDPAKVCPYRSGAVQNLRCEGFHFSKLIFLKNDGLVDGGSGG